MTRRRIGNKWETGLLWKEDDPRFPDNYNGARKRLTNIENKMDRDPLRRRVHGANRKINRKRVRAFRIGSVAFTGDIRDMFLRVRVCAPDQRAQLFLWRGADRDSEPVYEYPNAEMAVKRDHYVDDFICSTDSVPEAAKLISDVTIVHARGLRYPGWATNAPELKKACRRSRPRRPPPCHCTRRKQNGRWAIWEPECDSLGFDVTFKKLPRDIVNGKNKPTKRQFLSLIMSIFDPLGLLCPVTIKGKILMQRIWRSGIGWDDVLLERDYAKWVDYLDEVRKLSQLRIPRCYALRSSKIELHVFGDASEHAYAAVAYWRAVRPDGTVHLALVAGKSRVAPNKVIAPPSLNSTSAPIVTSGVNSADNPRTTRRADCDLERWLNGPTFLLRNEDAWPIDNDVVDERVADDEVLLVDPPGAYVRPVLYFIRRLRKQQQPFGADDVIDAETRLLRASQRRAFSDEMRAAAVGGHSRGSSLRALDVMLTDDWLRVGGRLRRSPTLSFDENTPSY
ncbi:hypothetical protein EVAR_4609_1 [Eumeta japonica]|uniref:Uncharacterized protein n=1 Tax=Eumeta variegata TaxID=151549 RepID=A0A4C1SWB8_EUMVA|nr:hypothetical protein EVAR_4609_1 [Eumeta japonica]